MIKQGSETVVSKATAVAISKEISEAVNAILMRHGLGLFQIKTVFGDEYKCTIRASAVKQDEWGVNHLSPDAVLYNREGYIGQTNHGLVNLQAPIGTVFTCSNREFAFAGVTNRGKRRIIAVAKDGAQFKFVDSIIPTINKAANA